VTGSPPPVSERAERLLASPPLPQYIHEHFERRGEPWDGDRNPDGYVSMCIAENKIVFDLLEPKLSASRDVGPESFGYDAMIGSLTLRERTAEFMGRTFLGRRFAPEQIAVLNGAGTVLELLFHTIADPGDGVLVPTPSYAGFWADLETRDQLTIIPVHTRSEGGFQLTTDLLDAALAAADRPVKALLFTTPDNPLGRVYRPEEVAEIAAWAHDRALHLVVDEVYALSVFGEPQFSSVARLGTSLGDSTHIVWAFSKDFAASGLRAGVLITENEEVMGAVDALAYWACVSGDTQHLLAGMIEDTAWVDGFVAENRNRLRGAYDAATGALTAAGIPFLPGDAGFFVLCDMRRFTTDPTWEAEQDLWRRILEEANVNLTPGAACHVGEPGFMRLCFAGEPTEAVVAGIERVGRVVG